VAESPVICRRPLEPDAGNAAEGSEGPVPDWRFSHAFFRATDTYELKFLSFYPARRSRGAKAGAQRSGAEESDFMTVFCHVERSRDIFDFISLPHQ